MFSASTPVLQLEEKLLYARVTVPPMEGVVVGALADQEIRHVSAIDLFDLDVEEHVDRWLHGVADGVGQIVSRRQRRVTTTRWVAVPRPTPELE